MKIVIHYTKKSAAVVCAIILFIIGGITALSLRDNGTTTPLRIASSPINIPPQQNSEGPVDVKVTHDTKQSTKTTHVFTIVLDTHSGNLSTFDAQSNIVYRPTNGSETPPAAISGDQESHHRTIIAMFNNTTLPGTLAVKNLRSVSERTFPITL